MQAVGEETDMHFTTIADMVLAIITSGGINTTTSTTTAIVLLGVGNTSKSYIVSIENNTVDQIVSAGNALAADWPQPQKRCTPLYNSSGEAANEHVDCVIDVEDIDNLAPIASNASIAIKDWNCDEPTSIHTQTSIVQSTSKGTPAPTTCSDAHGDVPLTITHTCSAGIVMNRSVDLRPGLSQSLPPWNNIHTTLRNGNPTPTPLPTPEHNPAKRAAMCKYIVHHIVGERRRMNCTGRCPSLRPSASRGHRNIIASTVSYDPTPAPTPTADRKSATSATSTKSSQPAAGWCPGASLRKGCPKGNPAQSSCKGADGKLYCKMCYGEKYPTKASAQQKDRKKECGYCEQHMELVAGYCRPCRTARECRKCKIFNMAEDAAYCTACTDGRVSLWCEACTQDAEREELLCYVCFTKEHKKKCGNQKEGMCSWCKVPGLQSLTRFTCSSGECGSSFDICNACNIYPLGGKRAQCFQCWQHAGSLCLICESHLARKKRQTALLLGMSFEMVLCRLWRLSKKPGK